jgi:NAD(P)-dependent dehydrogenase (short-subunit alcohol dehydrogenase family)
MCSASHGRMLRFESVIARSSFRVRRTSSDPAGKMGHPEEIATVALFLASDDSSFVNGVELSVEKSLRPV